MDDIITDNIEENNYIVSPSPHIRDKESTQNIMLDVIIALFPAIGAGIWFFGYRAGVLILTTILSAVFFEWAHNRVTNRPNTVWDLSSVVSGLLLALCLPVTVPLWIPITGSFFMIIVVKLFFGGLGQNFLNPAISARVFLMISWPAVMTSWTLPKVKNLQLFSNPDAVTTATPLAMMQSGAQVLPSNIDLYFGNVAGSIGETSAAALLLGGLYLVFRKIIDWRIPVIYIATVFTLTWAFGEDPVFHILAGGLFLGAIFMATDYVTSPMTRMGHVIYALGLGVITVLIRLVGGYPEGVSYAILLMNVVTPLIDRIPRRRFGV